MFLEKLKNDVEVCASFNKTLAPDRNSLYIIRPLFFLVSAVCMCVCVHARAVSSSAEANGLQPACWAP